MSTTIEAPVSHGFDPQDFTRRVRGLYGHVFERQAQRIATALEGTTVVDLGAGSGFLTHRLRSLGFTATAVDLAPDTFEFARDAYGVEIDQRDIYRTGYADKSFDCTILKEVVYHLDFERALAEVQRITRRKLVIFQGTRNPLLAAGRFALRHREYNRQSPRQYVDVLTSSGWTIESLRYYDPLAFYLSGGVIGPVLCPPSRSLCRAVMTIDSMFERLLRTLHLDRFLCSRFLLVARVPSANSQHSPAARESPLAKATGSATSRS